jgi:hypothetical protein
MAELARSLWLWILFGATERSRAAYRVWVEVAREEGKDD